MISMLCSAWARVAIVAIYRALSTWQLRSAPSERRRRGLKKALKAGIEIKHGAEFIAPLWSVLEDNLARKHGRKPVHTAEEIAQLHALFPTEIEFVVAVLDGQIEAGVVLFLGPRVVHSQYIASSVTGYELCALDAVLEHCITQAQLRPARYFDFGNSNEAEGYGGESILEALDLEARYRISFWDTLVLQAAQASGAEVMYPRTFPTDRCTGQCESLIRCGRADEARRSTDEYRSPGHSSRSARYRRQCSVVRRQRPGAHLQGPPGG